ncbi:MAG: LysE family translocator [Candidatus Sumerlaeaceae bacterium]|nr:LysE family translocator [Candidatus Sumerlaeaceae bacterium]
MFNVFIYGFAFGFGAAVFPGPINLEVVRRAISRGPVPAIAFGMGAVTADVIYVLAISTGAAVVLNALPLWAQAFLYAVGSLLLCIIGVKALRSRCVAVVSTEDDAEPGEDAGPAIRERVVSLFRGYLLGLALTLGSPPTIFYWLLMSVTAAQHFGNGWMFSFLLGLGVLVACSGWVLTVSLIIGHFHKHLEPRYILFVERTVGAILIALAIYSAGKAVRLMNGMPEQKLELPVQGSSVFEQGKR